MIKNLLFTVTAFSLFFSSTVYSAGCSGSVCEGKIERLYIPSGNRIYIGTNGTETNLAHCTPVSNSYIKLTDSNPRFEEIYSLLLAAKFSDQEVFIRTYSNNSDCEVQYIYIE